MALFIAGGGYNRPTPNRHTFTALVPAPHTLVSHMVGCSLSCDVSVAALAFSSRLERRVRVQQLCAEVLVFCPVLSVSTSWRS